MNFDFFFRFNFQSSFFSTELSVSAVVVAVSDLIGAILRFLTERSSSNVKSSLKVYLWFNLIERAMKVKTNK